MHDAVWKMGIEFYEAMVQTDAVGTSTIVHNTTFVCIRMKDVYEYPWKCKLD